MGDLRSRTGWLRGAGLVIGLCAVLVGVFSSRVPAGAGTVGAELTLVANPSKELAVSAVGPFLQANALRPSGRSTRAVVEVTNRTRRPLVVHLRAATEKSDLDALVRVEILADSEAIYRGTLRGLRIWTRSGFLLAAKEARSLRVRVWLPPTTGPYERDYQTVLLDLQATSPTRSDR
jgi:hypothetical protein